jgi:tetratricopeptide (TPR) repeat protein
MWGYLGSTLHFAGRSDEAAPALKRAMALDPNNYVYMHLYADVLINMGMEADAKKFREKASMYSFIGNDERGFPRRDVRVRSVRSWEENEAVEAYDAKFEDK